MKARPTPAHTAGAAAFFPALLATILLCTAVRTASAQEQPLTTFEGSIRYAGTSEPAICYVIVSRTEDGVAIGYTTTDGEGHYTLSIRSGADSVVIAVSGMSVKTVRRTVPNVSGRHDFEVEESLFELDEVTVTAPKMEMKGDDTVSYNVASFRAQEDLVIEDVLRKLPGITVRDNGQILYKAKPIAGLTIDGMDLLKGRYGIATRNISPDHIASVEILENHQAIKALKDLVPSDKTYINLKLKASSRGVFLLSAAAGGGYGDGGLWNAEAAPMYFGHSSQHILTGKTNNTGDDLAYELEDLTSGTGRLNPVLSSATLASPPAIDKDRYYRNTSYSASLNELFRTSGGTDINLNLSYLNDTELRDNTSETRWMLPDSSVNLIREGISNVIGTDKVNAELSFKSNGDRLYVDNRNIFSAEFLDIASSVNGIGQDFDRTTLRASSTASLIRRSGEKSAFEINARAAYEHTPYSLAIARDGGQWAGAVQDVTADAFTASLFAGNVTSFRLWDMRIEPTLSASYRLGSLDSRLSTPLGQLEDPSEAANRLMMHRLRVAPAVYAYYSSLHVDLSIFIPVAYYMTFLDDRLGGTRTSRHKVFAEPSDSMKIKPAASTDINLGYSMSWSMPEISTLYGGAVLSDYRSLTRYAADLTEGMRNHFSLGLSYKDIFNMLFLNLSAGYSLTKPDILYGYDFDGIYSTTLTTRTGELSHTVSAGIELSKGFYWKDLTAKLELGASWTDSPFLLQEQVARMSMQGYSAGLDISLSPFKFLGLTYNGSVMYSLSRQASGENLTPLLTASNDLTLSFRLPAGIGLSLTGEHYHNSASSAASDFVLLDAALSYKWKRFRWELTCSNLLDTREYVYSVLSAASSFSTDYLIRPRSYLLKMFVTF